MYKDFHRLPMHSDVSPAAGNVVGEVDNDNITAMLLMSAFLNGEMREVIEAIGPFMPGVGKATIDAAIQARESARQISAQSKIKHAFEQDDQKEPDLGSVMEAVTSSNLIKDDKAKKGMQDMVSQFTGMQKEMERMQGMMQKVQSGDTSSLMFEMLGKSMPGMGDMGNMMNMMNMFKNMGQFS